MTSNLAPGRYLMQVDDAVILRSDKEVSITLHFNAIDSHGRRGICQVDLHLASDDPLGENDREDFIGMRYFITVVERIEEGTGVREMVISNVEPWWESRPIFSNGKPAIFRHHHGTA